MRGAVAALERGDLARLGELFAASHASLRDDYEVSIAELDALVSLAEAAGAYGARLLGGGFGGAVIVLVDIDRLDTVAGEIVAGYRSQTGLEARSMTVHASAGARIDGPT